MNAPIDRTTRAPTGGTHLPRTIGLHGRVAVQWAMAGGVTLGGFLVAALTLAGRLSAHALFATATALFLAGALGGLAHGAVLGFFGRPHGVPGRAAARDLALAGLYAVPGLAVAWLAAVWVAMTYVALYTARLAPLIGVGIGAAVGAATIAAATRNGWCALRNAYGRWPERGPGTVLVAGTFAALLVLFLADRPELWGTRVRFTEPGAVLLAALATLWIAGPVVTIGLRAAHRLPFPRPLAGLEGDARAATDLGVGLLAGALVGLVAAPVAGPAPMPTAAAAVVAGVSQALVDEVLLRLFLVTGTAWLILRTRAVGRSWAALLAVLVATVVQVALYTPGALAVGFPTWGGTATFLLLGVATPAAAFGAVFWRRGFGAALAADAAAVLVTVALVA